MKTPTGTLRHYIHLQLIVTIAACSLISTFGVYFIGELFFDHLYERARRTAFATVGNDITLFADLSNGLAQRSRGAGAIALRELGRQYSSPAAFAHATPSGLAAEAARLKVGEIYLIGPDGVVAATSFEPDRGLDLFSLGDDFKAFLEGLVGTGKVNNQSLSLSTQTGRINVYQFYSPPGSTVIIEISTTLRQIFTEAIPDSGYGKSIKQIFDLPSPGGDGKLVWLADLVTFGPGNVKPWSLLREGSASDLPMEFLEEAVRKGIAQHFDGNREYYARVAPLRQSGVDFFNSRFIEVFSIDLLPIRNFRLFCLLAGLAIAAMASSASWYRARRSFSEHVTKRIEGLVQRLKSAESDSCEGTADPSINDEISAISQGIGEMIMTLVEKNRELGRLSRNLEEELQERRRRERQLSELLQENQVLLKEVQHRVRNNLQVLLSLAALHSRESSDDAGVKALDGLRTHIIGMSLAQDLLFQSAPMTSIDIGRYLDDLAQSIIEMKIPESAGIITASVDAERIMVSMDVIIPLGLCIAELIANSCENDFIGRSEGQLRIRVERTIDELRVMVSDDGTVSESGLRGLHLEIVQAMCGQFGGSFAPPSSAAGTSSWLVSLPYRV